MSRIEGAGEEAVVADDDAFFRLAMTSVLTEHFGFARVHQAGSLDDAIEVLAERPAIRLALFDLAMPGMAGPGNLAAVRECNPGVTTVVVSGSTRREDVFLALRAGVHGFVAKGSSVDTLVQALRIIQDGFVLVPSFVTRIDEAPTCETLAVGANPAGCLTPRQRQVLDLIAAGRSNKEIARSLSLGEGTVKIHVTALLRALGVPNRSAAAAWAVANRVASLALP
jgi:DNA-binding NarL/FixJ family response regulator